MNPIWRSTNLGDFSPKKHFALRFRMFRAHGGKKWGSIKHPATYIYICINIYMSGGTNLLPKFLPMSFFGCVSRFRGASSTWHSNKENAGVSWNAAWSCPVMPSNCANWYLVLISFRSRSGADHSLDFLGW